ncbi:hypothetical protein [Sphingomonas bacterium]|uniref:hypothetical protein n=1 Tax=Sphingomonas bacterium TaxID=1895847 RepID=UPI001576E8A8|nr:hypothetical protein [Sphingomonas bacterium]
MRVPLLIGNDGSVIEGQVLLLAAQAIGLPEIPVIHVTDLNPLHERMLSATLSRVGELGRWKKDKQRALLAEIIDTMPSFDLEGLALDMGEIDLILDGTRASYRLRRCNRRRVRQRANERSRCGSSVY